MVLNEIDIMKKAVNDPVYSKYLAEEYEKDAANQTNPAVVDEKKPTTSGAGKQDDK